MKKTADQVNFVCLLMFLVCLACKMVPENWHICVNKGIAYYLLTSSMALISGNKLMDWEHHYSSHLSSDGQQTHVFILWRLHARYRRSCSVFMRYGTAFCKTLKLSHLVDVAGVDTRSQ